MLIVFNKFFKIHKNQLKIYSLLIISILFIVINFLKLNFYLPIEYDEIKYLKVINLGFFNNYFDFTSMDINEYFILVKSKFINPDVNIDNFIFSVSENSDPHFLRGYHPILPFYYWIFFSYINDIFFNIETLIFLRFSNILIYLISFLVVYRLLISHAFIKKQYSFNLNVILLTIIFSSPISFINTIYLSPHIFIFPTYIYLAISVLDFKNNKSDFYLYKMIFAFVLLIFSIESVVLILPIIFFYFFYILKNNQHYLSFIYIKFFFSLILLTFILWPASFLKLSFIKIYFVSFYRIFVSLDKYLPGKGNLHIDDKINFYEFIFLNNIFAIFLIISLLITSYYFFFKNRNLFYLIIVQSVLYLLLIWPIIARADYITFTVLIFTMLSSYLLMKLFEKKFLLFNFLYLSVLVLISFQSHLFVNKFTIDYLNNFKDYNKMVNYLKEYSDNQNLIYSSSGLKIDFNLNEFNFTSSVKNITFNNSSKFQFNLRKNYNYYNGEDEIINSKNTFFILDKNYKINNYTENALNKFGDIKFENSAYIIYQKK